MLTCKCSNEGRWINDGHGIPLAVVCDSCEPQVLSGFRSDIMERYDCDEPIEPDSEWMPAIGFGLDDPDCQY